MIRRRAEDDARARGVTLIWPEPPIPEGLLAWHREMIENGLIQTWNDDESESQCEEW